MTVRRIPENVPRIRAFVLLRYTLIIATAYLLLVEHEFSSLPSGLILLIVIALTSNVLMMWLPARITDSTAFNATVIIGDTVWITAALLYSGLFRADFFYVYFFVLLLAAIGENLFSIALGAIVTCTAYLYILSNTTTSLPVWSSSSLIRIPFLFTAAAFYGYLVDRVRREQQRARAEADTVALLEHEISERERVESALRESEERYRKVVELSPDAILVHSEGTIDYVNTAGGRLFGAGDPEQLIGTPVMDIVHPDYREAVKERIQQRIGEGTVLPLTEEKIIRLDGTEVDVEVTAAPFTYDENPGVLAVIRDITERKQAEEELQARAGELAVKTERLEGLATLSRTASATLDPQQVFEFVVGATVRLLDANLSLLWLWDEAAGVLRLAAVDGDANLVDYPRKVSRPGQGMSGLVFERRESLITDAPATDPRFAERAWAQKKGIHAYAAVPLLVGERAVGVLTAVRRNPGSFQTEDLTLMNSFAAQVAIAIENARLYSEALEKTKRLEGLIRTSAKVSGTLQAEEVLVGIAEEAAGLLGVEGAGFRLIEGDRLVVGGRYGLAHQVMLNPSLQLGESLSGLVAQEARPISVPDLGEDRFYLPEHKAAAVAHGVTSYLGVPLRYRERIIGVLNVFGKERRTFDKREVNLLQAFADQAAITIENARHMHDAESRARRLQALTDVTRLMTSSLDHRQVALSIVRAAAELLGADMVRLWVADETTQALHLRVSHGCEDLTATPYVRIGKGQGVIGAVWETGEPAFIPDLREEPRWLNVPLLERTGLRAFAGLPFTIEDRVMGVLSLFTRGVRRFTPEERELMALFADQAAISLDKARLYREMTEQKQYLEETVAERKRAAEALQAAKDYAEDIIDSSLDMIISTDLHRKIVEFNRAAEHAFGYSKAEVLGRPVDLLYANPSEGARVFTTILEDGMFIGEVTNKRKNGEIFCCYLSASVIRDASGRVAGGMGISRDITEQKRADEELRATQLQLIQSEKLESVGRLAAGVAHEVKNPLAIIQQGLAYISDAVSTTDGDTVALVLEKMDNAVKRADRVIMGLLDFSAPRAIDATPVELNAVVEESLLLVKHQLVKAHITVVKELGEDLPPIKLDWHKIEQVFVNLFINAIQAMPEGGTLTVKTDTKQVTELGPDVAGRETDPSTNGKLLVVAEVEDTGTGIPDNKLDRVFDPFFTTKPPGQGTGLGLTVTQKIMELHGAMINIRNRHEGGVRATLTFGAKGGHGDAEETRS